MLKGGVIMDVTNAEQAVIAEKAGAAAVMALERVPSDIRKEGGVARMAPISKIREIMQQVSIPVMAKARIGHFTEARILEALGVDYIDESEVLTPADEEHHIDKRDFKVPFVCGARNLGEALRRIAEGAAMIRTKGEAGSGNIVEAVRHIRTIVKEMKQLTVLGKEELVAESKKHAGAAGTGRVGGRARQAAGAELFGRRHRHARRRGAGDAARRRGGVRRLGHFQIVRPRSARARHRESRDLFQRSGEAAGSERRAGHGDARPGHLEIAGVGIDADPRLVVAVSKKRVGVLALQGDFEAHERALERAGAEAGGSAVGGGFEGIDGLVIPGGESTTMLKLLRGRESAGAAARVRPASGRSSAPARARFCWPPSVANPPQESLGLMDIDVERNAYGRQLDSRIARLQPEGMDGRTGSGLHPRSHHSPRWDRGKVLARYEGDPVLVEQGRHLAATFHPELTEDSRVHLMFLQKIP